MTVPNLLRVVLKWSGYGEEGDIGAFFAHAPQMYSEAELDTALAAVDSALQTNTTPSSWQLLEDLITTSQSYTDLAIYQYPVAPGPSGVLAHRAPSPAHSGAGAAVHPLQVSAVASILTGSASRRKRGRMYLPAHTQAVASNAQFSQTVANKFEATASGYLADVLGALRGSLTGGDPIRHVVFSRAGGLSTDSTSVVVDSRPDIQRRRAGKITPALFSTAGHVNP